VANAARSNAHSKPDKIFSGDLTAIKIGLVLAGGGAKGAYQAGCLDYLREQGIESFEVVTGTSVGSLNGAAAASGRVGQLVAVWQNISFSQILMPSARALPALLGGLLAWLLLYLPLSFGAIGIGLIVGWIAHNTLLGVFTVLLGLGTASNLLFFGPIVRRTVRWSGSRLLSRTTQHAAVARNTRLSHLIEGTLFPNGIEQLQTTCPVIATSAVRRRWFDPDYAAFHPDSPFFGWAGDTAHIDLNSPAEIPGWLPIYFDLTDLPRDEVVSYLLASAALPWAFRRMKLGQDFHVDGGIVENVPLSKALEYDCDLIIVIYLKADQDLPTTVLNQVPRLRRALRVANMDIQQTHALYLSWLRKDYPNLDDEEWRDKLLDIGVIGVPRSREALEVIPCEELKDLPPIIHVIPSQPLGGLMRGTLNFGQRKARRLLALGWLDMRRAMDDYGG
jgi:predicted acylesterase/phospholipase RssA